MIRKMILLWVIGLLTVVPYCVYYLLFQAERSEYAFYIVMPLFWIFGYWGVVGPIISALKVRSLFKAIELCRSGDEVARLFREPGNEEAVVELIADENGIPRFIARRLYRQVLARLAQQGRQA